MTLSLLIRRSGIPNRRKEIINKFERSNFVSNIVTVLYVTKPLPLLFLIRVTQLN